jgi:glyceraldehyde 3-phosphate dehydrogenase
MTQSEQWVSSFSKWMRHQHPKVIKATFASRWPGILTYTEDPIVSSDVIGESVSCLFDAKLTSVIGQMVKVVGWYDNEMGYSHRLRDVLLKMA